MNVEQKQKLIIGISGASGAIYGIRALQLLRLQSSIETHLVVSKAAAMTIACETSFKMSEVIALADVHYQVEDVGACIASGSFKTMGMLVAPCSIKTMSEIASGMTANLLSRAADVVLKEKRRLVLMVRETPLHYGHLHHMALLAQAGAVIAPPVPAFYNQPQSLDDIINHSVSRALDLFDIETQAFKRWQGMKDAFVSK